MTGVAALQMFGTRFIKRIVMAFFMALLLVGCSSMPSRARKLARYEPSMIELDTRLALEKDPEFEKDPTEALVMRRLRPGARILISLRGIPVEKDIQDVIDESGAVNLPHLGVTSLAGMTTSEAEKMIESAYVEGGIFRQVTVTIVSQEDEYYVRGEVRRSGRYPLSREMTVLQAIAAAGGFTDYADRKRIRVSRGSGSFRVSAKRVEQKKDKDPLVEPGDMIIVDQGW